jgi:hypothetical protein
VIGRRPAQVASKDILVDGRRRVIAGRVLDGDGQWISWQSSRELSARELAVEQRHIETSRRRAGRAGARLRAEGAPPERGEKVAERLSADPRRPRSTFHAREELGIRPDELGGSPWVAADCRCALRGRRDPADRAVRFLSGQSGATSGRRHRRWRCRRSALFGIGAAITLLTGRSVLVPASGSSLRRRRRSP